MEAGFQPPVQAILRQALSAYLVLLVKAVVDLRYSVSLAEQRRGVDEFHAENARHKIYMLGGAHEHLDCQTMWLTSGVYLPSDQYWRCVLRYRACSH